MKSVFFRKENNYNKEQKIFSKISQICIEHLMRNQNVVVFFPTSYSRSFFFNLMLEIKEKSIYILDINNKNHLTFTNGVEIYHHNCEKESFENSKKAKTFLFIDCSHSKKEKISFSHLYEIVEADDVEELIFYDDLEGENINFLNFFKKSMLNGDKWWKIKKIFLKKS